MSTWSLVLAQRGQYEIWRKLSSPCLNQCILLWSGLIRVLATRVDLVRLLDLPLNSVSSLNTRIICANYSASYITLNWLNIFFSFPDDAVERRRKLGFKTISNSKASIESRWPENTDHRPTDPTIGPGPRSQSSFGISRDASRTTAAKETMNLVRGPHQRTTKKNYQRNPNRNILTKSTPNSYIAVIHFYTAFWKWD